MMVPHVKLAAEVDGRAGMNAIGFDVEVCWQAC